MKQWLLIVAEEDQEYFYHFDTWEDAVARLGLFDGLSVSYNIFRIAKKTLTTGGSND